MENCVRYQISLEEARVVAEINKNERQEILTTHDFWEVWEGLPQEYAFQPAASRDGYPSLRAKRQGVYIWITTEAREAIEKKPCQMLFALGQRKHGSLNFPYVCLPQENFTLQQAINHAQGLNASILREAAEIYKKKRRAKKARQKVGD